MIKIVHIITSLEVGGAQRLLDDLCRGLSEKEFEHVVVCLTRETDLAIALRDAGHRVHCLNLSSITGIVFGVYRTALLLRAEKADVVHTWLYHADLIGGMAAVLSGSRPIIWSIHHASADLEHEKLITRLVVRVLSGLSSRIPDIVAYCSEHSRVVHQSLGYSATVETVINNGVDTARFQPSEEYRRAFRQEIEASEDVATVGLVARFDSIKGVDVFLRMAERLCEGEEKVCFVMAGTGMSYQNSYLREKIEERELVDAIRLLGERSDIERVMCGLDVLVCPSFAESFGLVVAEALACGVPVVASEISVLQSMVGSCWTATIGDDDEFARKVRDILVLPIDARRLIARDGRVRIVENFSIDSMLEQYARLYKRSA